MSPLSAFKVVEQLRPTIVATRYEAIGSPAFSGVNNLNYRYATISACTG
jgi:hypothetical protein